MDSDQSNFLPSKPTVPWRRPGEYSAWWCEIEQWGGHKKSKSLGHSCRMHLDFHTGCHRPTWLARDGCRFLRSCRATFMCGNSRWYNHPESPCKLNNLKDFRWLSSKSKWSQWSQSVPSCFYFDISFGQKIELGFFSDPRLTIPTPRLTERV